MASRLPTSSSLVVALLVGCATSSVPTRPSSLGVSRPSDALLPLLSREESAGAVFVEVESVVSANWRIQRSGLINLDHPTARAAGLQEGEEPIQIFFHAIRHPSAGMFIIDSGVTTAQRDCPDQAVLSGLAAKAMNADALEVTAPLGEWLARQDAPLAGVFLTHLHLDHVLGLPDIPKGTRVFTGPGEAGARSAMNLFVQGLTDEALKNVDALEEWAFDSNASGPFGGAIDLFGDGSFWALWVPGHTPGSTAYLARTPAGPVLFVGDASHTRWGWEHDVEPGSFTADGPLSIQSFRALRTLVAAHPEMQVRLGHQHAAQQHEAGD